MTSPTKSHTTVASEGGLDDSLPSELLASPEVAASVEGSPQRYPQYLSNRRPRACIVDSTQPSAQDVAAVKGRQDTDESQQLDNTLPVVIESRGQTSPILGDVNSAGPAPDTLHRAVSLRLPTTNIASNRPNRASTGQESPVAGLQNYLTHQDVTEKPRCKSWGATPVAPSFGVSATSSFHPKRLPELKKTRSAPTLSPPCLEFPVNPQLDDIQKGPLGIERTSDDDISSQDLALQRARFRSECSQVSQDFSSDSCGTSEVLPGSKSPAIHSKRYGGLPPMSWIGREFSFASFEASNEQRSISPKTNYLSRSSSRRSPHPSSKENIPPEMAAAQVQIPPANRVPPTAQLPQTPYHTTPDDHKVNADKASPLSQHQHTDQHHIPKHSLIDVLRSPLRQYSHISRTESGSSEELPRLSFSIERPAHGDTRVRSPTGTQSRLVAVQYPNSAPPTQSTFKTPQDPSAGHQLAAAFTINRGAAPCLSSPQEDVEGKDVLRRERQRRLRAEEELSRMQKRYVSAMRRITL